MTRERRETPPVLQPGRTCWKTAGCSRLALLIDGKAYFDALASSLAKAEKSVLLAGWDFDSRISLRPEKPDFPSLGLLLRSLVEARESLEIRLMIWRNSIFYGKNADIPLPFGESWWSHPRIHLKLDDHHPLSACHHQKIVAIDGKTAFIGGMDLTQCRWDDPQHAPDNPLRFNLSDEPYPPIHDVHAVVDGEAAEALHDLVAKRWQCLTDETLAPVICENDVWPQNVRPVIRNHEVAIARTQPALGRQTEAREVERLNHAMLSAAKRAIYIETQYFAEPQAADILARHLREPHGPEVVIVANRESHGFLEQYVMAENRDRLFAMLRKADLYGRLRTFYPVVGNGADEDISIHSKVVVVDDRLFRVGSSNFNSRSLGMDTECDIAIDAGDDATRRTIMGLRDTLLAEHLGCDPGRFTQTCTKLGSLVRAVDELNGGPTRRLIAYPVDPALGEASLTPGSSLLDPPRPIELTDLFSFLKPTPRAE